MIEKITQQEAFRFFEEHYNCIFLYNQKPKIGGFEVVDIHNNKVVSNPTYRIKDSSKMCRYCGKTEPNVTFKSKAHTFPEFLGNKLFVSINNECDECNMLFSKYEMDLNRVIYPYLVINSISGKGGIKKYKSNDKTSTIEKINNDFHLTEIMGSAKIIHDDENKQFSYEFDIQPYTPMNIYKIMSKMALAILPEKEIENFKIMRKYILDDKLYGFEKLILDFFPGFNRFDFLVQGFKRKSNNEIIPSYQFIIMNGNIKLQVPIYNDSDLKANNGKTITIKMESSPTPYDFHELGDKTTRIIDLSSDVLKRKDKQKIIMKYDEKLPPIVNK